MEKLDWLDVLEIAIELNDRFPETDPQWIGFPDLHTKVCELSNFVGDPQKSSERILEAIQMHWIEEYQ
jgi:FeS assembly protein IscX